LSVGYRLTALLVGYRVTALLVGYRVTALLVGYRVTALLVGYGVTALLVDRTGAGRVARNSTHAVTTLKMQLRETSLVTSLTNQALP
jgi:hypothetical protein